MALAQIGPLTAILEALATAVGAGIPLGGFAMGTVGLLARWPRRELAARALTDGYAGGIGALLILLIDLLLRYG
jgi:NAD kinase